MSYPYGKNQNLVSITQTMQATTENPGRLYSAPQHLTTDLFGASPGVVFTTPNGSPVYTNPYPFYRYGGYYHRFLPQHSASLAK